MTSIIRMISTSPVRAAAPSARRSLRSHPTFSRTRAMRAPMLPPSMASGGPYRSHPLAIWTNPVMEETAF